MQGHPVPDPPPDCVHASSVEQAQTLLLASLTAKTARPMPLAQALGHVAAKEHRARWPLPQWDLSRMDGYLLGPAGEDAARYRCVGESAAGAPSALQLSPGECLRVSTGALLPSSGVAVVPQEDVRQEGSIVALNSVALEQLRPGRFIRLSGSDVADQQLLCNSGQRLDMGTLALLAAAGHSEISVHAPPRVGILSTGSELVPLGQTPARGQIVATNAMVLRWQCEQAKAQIVEELEVPDDRVRTQEALAALAQRCDLVLSCGGISVGPHDHILPSLQALHWQPLFRKVKLAPGRPTTAGRLGQATIIALPGNPASAYVTFELFVRPLLRHLAGHQGADRFRAQRMVKCEPCPPADHERCRYLRVRVQGDRAQPLAQQQSGDLSSLRGHNALLHIPSHQGQGRSQDRFRALLLSEEQFEDPEVIASRPLS